MNHHFCFLRITEDFANNTLPITTIKYNYFRPNLRQRSQSFRQSVLRSTALHQTSVPFIMENVQTKAVCWTPTSTVLMGRLFSSTGLGCDKSRFDRTAGASLFYFLLHMRLNPSHTYIYYYILIYI